MRYISTRGNAPSLSFSEVLLAGTAPDGGLYVPERWPSFTADEIAALCGKSYAEIAYHLIAPFIGDDLPDADIRAVLAETYGDGAQSGGAFDDPAVAPLRTLDEESDLWLMELFHGPTFSFKDYALQCLGRLFDLVLSKQNERITIVGATSGDTGSAAIEACRGLDNVDIFILHPEGRTSAIQRKQMTTVEAPNVHNIALQGNFDDCQAQVKALFADAELRESLNLSAVNSINWVRIMMQIVYYAAACISFIKARGRDMRNVSFCVPTGNFGNVFAAYAARKMGLPIEALVIGTNRNDIITRFFETGTMNVETVTSSLSPSMDIQVSSNFERYLFETLGRDAAAVSGLMDEFAAHKSFSVPPDILARAQADFAAYRCDDPETEAMIAACFKYSGVLIDPHTAVAYGAAHKARADGIAKDGPLVVLACAHPAKFPEAVITATGDSPAVPSALAAVLGMEEHVSVLPNDLEAVRDFITARAANV